MFFKKKKKVFAFNGKRFIAAYSQIPFVESPNGETNTIYPDYAFYKNNGFYWVVRVGTIKIPWGFGKFDGVPYYANGTLYLKRGNQSVDGWDGLSLPYKLEGDVYRLYESELENGRNVGFCNELQDLLRPRMVEIAKESSLADLGKNLNERLNELCQEFLEQFGLWIEKVEINQKGNYKENVKWNKTRE